MKPIIPNETIFYEKSTGIELKILNAHEFLPDEWWCFAVKPEQDTGYWLYSGKYIRKYMLS